MMDVLIINGKTVNDEPVEIAIKDGQIIDVASKLEYEATQTINLNKRSYISAGWIDAHTHCYEDLPLYHDSPDEIGYTKGVTTVVDAGTTGAENIGDFYRASKDSITNVKALLNISKTGIVKQSELADMNDIDEKLVLESIEKYEDFIVGFKARMSKTVVGENGILPLKSAKSIQKKSKKLPLMVHIGSAPPLLEDILELLEDGDILTHCFNGKENNIMDNHQRIKRSVWEAYNRGVVFDIGHGTDSFNFDVAEVAFKEGLTPHTLSTDIYHRNRENGPVVDFSTTIEKLIVVGYSLQEIIPMITTKPAEMYHLNKKGHIKEQFDADFTIFNVESETKVLTDSNGNTRTTDTVIKPTHTIIDGSVYTLGG
ncbi:amidohydrolase/deacetylase family metallohydrolase [Marinilactibacillus sp. XAAS-LB27]|uniref:amidohydrolase/deacetylase family metallohydrolase n=1 Tax=Marinilactibacillus sp. XAAS-LB27 TaxID=3114538 RepID=UPI002E1953A0|nr:amidohydrolase/deacetylase family metallohydrolase [Marinilactibacillus sp. XAAS-LB27]